MKKIGIFFIKIAVIEVYLWICTYSLYQKIRDDMNDTHPERSPDIPYTHIH